MGEVLVRDEKPRDIWDQHARILDAITEGNGERAEALVRSHITQASGFMVEKLRSALG
jgi:DNA-binding GntR family transcriptional regulator